jgi:hypothetical protein
MSGVSGINNGGKRAIQYNPVPGRGGFEICQMGQGQVSQFIDRLGKVLGREHFPVFLRRIFKLTPVTQRFAKVRFRK